MKLFYLKGYFNRYLNDEFFTLMIVLGKLHFNSVFMRITPASERQLSLFSEANPRNNLLMKTIDRLNRAEK